MRIGIITPNLRSRTTDALFRSFSKLGIRVEKIPLGDIIFSINHSKKRPDLLYKNAVRCNGEEGSGKLSEFDGIIIRGIGINRVKKIFYRLDIYRALEILGIPAVNSRECMELCTNKMLAGIIFGKNGIPTPETVVCENYYDAMRAFKELGGDVLLKPLFGSKGKGIIRITDEGFAEYIFRAISQLDEPFYIQKFYEHGNKDIRILILGEQILAAIERIGTGWKTNISKGAVPRIYKPDKEIAEMAIKCGELVQGIFVGVDIIITSEGPMVIEVNAVPGFMGAQKVYGKNLAEEIAAYFIRYFRNV